MEGASAEGEAAVPFAALVASGEAHEEAAAPAAEARAEAPAKPSGAAGSGGTRPQDVTERSTPRFLRSLHQALFGLGTREAATQPDAEDQAFMELLSDAIGKTETELHKRQGAVPKAPDRTAERYWSQYWLAVLHDEEPLTPKVVAMRRTAKERMAFETSKYVNPAAGGNKLDLFYAVSAALSHASGVTFTPEELNQACASFSNKERSGGGGGGGDDDAPSGGSKTGVKSVNRAQLQELLARKKLALEDFKRKVFKARLTPDVLAKVKAGLAELAELEKKSAADAGTSKRKPKGGGGGGGDDEEEDGAGDGGAGGDAEGPGGPAPRGKRSKRGPRGGGGGGADAADAGVAAGGDIGGAVMAIDAPLQLPPLLHAEPPAELLRPTPQRAAPMAGCAAVASGLVPLHHAASLASAR